MKIQQTHILLKAKKRILFSFLLFLSCMLGYSQEWKSFNCYKKETGRTTLDEGCWLKKDRKKKTEVWEKANAFNLSTADGHLKYRSISEFRDFYAWFESQRKLKGHEIKWIGVTKIVATQLSNFDNGLVRFIIVRNKEVSEFAKEGSVKVFEFAFPRLQSVYFSEEPITGSAAEKWDFDYGTNEQCLVLEPLYNKLSPKALRKLNRIAKGKGIFSLAVEKQLQYVGDIEDCHARYEHGLKICTMKNQELQEAEPITTPINTTN